MLQCKKCQTNLFANNAEEDHGDVIVICTYCGVKNVLAPVLINKVPVDLLYVIGYKD